MSPIATVPGRRLAAQLVTRPTKGGTAAVVRALVAVQAQDYLGSLWALGLRQPSAIEAEIEQAIVDRSIVRTWPMRGTLHFVAAEDARWLARLLTPRVVARSAGRHRELELDASVFTKTRRVFERAMEGGRVVRRTTLYERLEAVGVRTDEGRGLHILAFHAQEALICFGPRDGKQQTFVLLDEWLGAETSKDRDAALAELAARYFESHGPATVADFTWWSGLTIKEAQTGIALAGDRLEEIRIDGTSHWSGEAGRLPRATGTAFLLPPFDEYTVAYRDRSAVVEPANWKQVNAGGGMLNPIVVWEGRVIGTWRRTLAPKQVRIAIKPFRPLAARERAAIAKAAVRYGRFLGLPAVVD